MSENFGQKSDHNLVKAHNRALVLDEIRREPLSRVMLAKATGLSKSAMTAIIKALMVEGRLCETEAVSVPRGRRPVLLDIQACHRYAAGIFLHRKMLGALITDAKADIVAQTYRPPTDFQSGDEAIVWLCDQVEALAYRHGIARDKLHGVGISSPGPVDREKGLILNPPNFELFHDTAILEKVKTRLALPAMLENNAVLLAMREYYKGGMTGLDNTLFITISSGIGACIMRNGQVYRGVGGFAGELGHTSIDVHGEACLCGNRGCLELYATLGALQKRFGFEDYHAIVLGAQAGDAFALEVLEYEVRCLAGAIINAVNLLDLDSVILYGELNKRPALLLGLLEAQINQQSMLARAHRVKVKASVLNGVEAASATAAVLDDYFHT